MKDKRPNQTFTIRNSEEKEAMQEGKKKLQNLQYSKIRGY